MEIFGPLPEPQIRYAAHNHDMVAAAPAWDFYEIRFGAEPYKPESIDIAFGAFAGSALQGIGITPPGPAQATTSGRAGAA